MQAIEFSAPNNVLLRRQLQFDKLAFEVCAIGVGPNVYTVQQVKVLSLEQRAQRRYMDFLRPVDGFLGNNQVAGDHIGHRVNGHGMRHGADALRDAHFFGQLRVAVKAGFQLVQRLPHLKLERGAEQA